MTLRLKYPRTFHLPFSPGLQSDDKMVEDLSFLENKQVVATVKMDGENTSLYSDGYLHARSIDSKSNWTRDVAKKLHSEILHEIPSNWRLCCENVYAKHSIYYPPGYLKGYLYLLSVWDENNKCLSWEDTLEFSGLWKLPTPEVLYEGIFDLKKLQEVAKNLDTELQEGFVVRLKDSFDYNDFSRSVVKYVRKGHVQTDEHWLKSAIPNGAPGAPFK